MATYFNQVSTFLALACLSQVYICSGQFLNCHWVESLDCSRYTKQLECGTNGITYQSRCHLAKAQCRRSDLHIQHDGACVSTTSSTKLTTRSTTTPSSSGDGFGVFTSISCSYISRQDCYTYGNHPECGTDGVTYRNRCDYSKAHCNDPNIHVAHYGACQISTTTITTPRPTTRTTTPTPSPICINIIASRDCEKEASDPVCSNTGVTFRNRCAISKAVCHDPSAPLLPFKDGPCDVTTPSTSEPLFVGSSLMLDIFCRDMLHQDCPADSHVFCGTDRKTYTNICEFDKLRCSNRSLDIAYMGSCR